MPLGCLLVVTACAGNTASDAPGRSAPAAPSITLSSGQATPGQRVEVRVAACPHGTTGDYGVFFHDHREVAVDHHEQNGLLHPRVTWTSPTSGVASLRLPLTARRGLGLVTVVCDSAGSPGEAPLRIE